MKKLIHCMFLAVSLLLLPTLVVPTWVGMAKAQSQNGSVSGMLSIKSDGEIKKVAYKYVYAWMKGSSKSADITILFTDQPVPDDPMERRSYIRLIAREGKLNALEIMLDENRKLELVAVYCQTFSTVRSLHDTPNPHPPPGLRPFPPAPIKHILELKAGNDTLAEGRVSSDGEIHCSDSFENCSEDADDIDWAYDVSFKTPIRRTEGDLVTYLPEGGGEPGMAYAQFYQAAQAQDLQAIRRLVATDALAAFEGPDAPKRAARLKQLTEGLKWVMPDSYVYASGKVAQIHARDVGARIWKTPSPPGQLAPWVQPPLPPHADFSSVPGGAAPRASSRRNSTSRASQPPSISSPPAPEKLAAIRMLLEHGQWKASWLMLDVSDLEYGVSWFDEVDHGNLLWHLDTYKTEAERAAEGEDEDTIEDLTGGNPLPAGGAEPGRAYLEFCKAERMRDKKTLVKFLTGDSRDTYSQPTVQLMPGFAIWKKESAVNYTKLEVAGGTIEGQQAVLNIRGLVSGHTATARVKMILEGAQWKVENENWKVD
jgi:hypothetical protein